MVAEIVISANFSDSSSRILAGSSEDNLAETSLVVSDVRMDRAGGLDVLRTFTDKAPETPVILITAFGDVTGAMEAIQRGAYDYVSKPFNIEELRLTVARSLERKRLVAEQKAEPSEKKTNTSEGRASRAIRSSAVVTDARVASASRNRTTWTSE